MAESSHRSSQANSSTRLALPFVKGTRNVVHPAKSNPAGMRRGRIGETNGSPKRT